MHFSTSESCHLLLLCSILLKSCQAFKNDATEMLYPYVSPPVQEAASNVSLNRARNGGRSAGNGANDRGERGQLGCRELRSTKYISDGQCTSINPIKELVCAGECLPAQLLPNWIGGGRGRKYWNRRSEQDWRCVNDKTRTQRIQLQCQDGSSRTYKITVVTACKCKRYSRQHNESGNKLKESALSQPAATQKHKSKGKKKKNKPDENWHEAEH